MGGFFANPNEAAMASCLAVALVLALPFRARPAQLAAIAIAAGAVVLTLSKTGMSVLVVVIAWHALRRLRSTAFAATVLAGLTALLLVQASGTSFEAIGAPPLIELDAQQKARILAVADILGGRIDEQTTTGRTFLWAVVAERAWSSFPLGGGLGSAHSIVGGILEGDAWQGAHNTVLMIWGESGILPALLLVAGVAAAAFGSLRHARGTIASRCLFVLLIDMMATHGALAARYHDVMLAIVLGLLANARHRPGVAAGRDGYRPGRPAAGRDRPVPSSLRPAASGAGGAHD